jgi:hypothetical protein
MTEPQLLCQDIDRPRRDARRRSVYACLIALTSCACVPVVAILSSAIDASLFVLLIWGVAVLGEAAILATSIRKHLQLRSSGISLREARSSIILSGFLEFMLVVVPLVIYLADD